MGCGGSKDSDKNPNEIKYQMDHVKASGPDDFFKPIGEALQAAEEIRKGVEDDKGDALELTHAFKLKDKGQRMKTAFQVLFWAISAGNGGDVKKTKIDIMNELPFLKIEKDGGLHADTNKLIEAANGFLQSCAQGPEKLTKIVTELTAAAEKAASLKDDSSLNDLGALDKAKALKAIAKNSALLTKNLPKVKDLLPKVTDAAKDMKEIGPSLKGLIDNADETGKKASENKKTSPSEIFDEYIKDGLLTEEEIKAEKEEGKKDKKK